MNEKQTRITMVPYVKDAMSDIEAEERIANICKVVSNLAKNGCSDRDHFRKTVLTTFMVANTLYKKKDITVICKCKDNYVRFFLVNSNLITGKKEQSNADIVMTYGKVLASVNGLPRDFVSDIYKELKILPTEYILNIPFIIW